MGRVTDFSTSMCKKAGSREVRAPAFGRIVPVTIG